MSEEEITQAAQEAEDEEGPAEASPETSESSEDGNSDVAAAEAGPSAKEEIPVEETETQLKEERDPLSREPVIDLTSLLMPIEGENPSGEYLRYQGVYDEISEARRADDVLGVGDWETNLKTADFRLVIQLAIPIIEKQTKDLQIAAWLVEALVAEHGFTGLRDGLHLLSEMTRRFWDSIYPSAEDGDEEGRANALAWIDRESAFLVKNAAITVDGWGYNGFLDSKKYDIPPNLETLPEDEKKRFAALKEQADRENRATASRWTAAVAKTNRAFCEEVHVAILECEKAYSSLNDAIEEKFDRNQAPSLPALKKSLEEIKSLQTELLEAKRIEEPDPDDAADAGVSSGDGEGRSGRSGVSGPISNRADALKRLGEVAAFFRKTEPHSPVAYLVNRAIQWGNMPLENWLQDVIKDQNILNQIKQTLGFNTVAETTVGEDQPAAGEGSQDTAT